MDSFSKYIIYFAAIILNFAKIHLVQRGVFVVQCSVNLQIRMPHSKWFGIEGHDGECVMFSKTSIHHVLNINHELLKP